MYNQLNETATGSLQSNASTLLFVLHY